MQVSESARVAVVACIVSAAMITPLLAEQADERVEWDALEVGKLYMIRSTVHAQGSYRTRVLGVWRFDGGGMFKVIERRLHGGVLWYRMQWIKPMTIGDHEDIRGWTVAESLREHGAYEVD